MFSRAGRILRGKKTSDLQKKRSSKKFGSNRQKSRPQRCGGAANLKSAPGGRHPSYASGKKT